MELGSYRDVRLPLDIQVQGEVAQLLRGVGIGAGESYVVMHAGAKRQTNQWPVERYAAVADEIVRRWDTRLILTGSAAELPFVAEVASRMAARPVVLCGKMSLRQLAGVLRGAVLYVGNDTGPMHIAAAVGTKIVAIFSARDFPERWSPAGEGHLTLRRDAPCSPCFRESCNRDQFCIKAISADDVLAAVDAQFNVLKFRVLAASELA